MEPGPPKLAQQLFCWYCRNDLQDSILGDLDERFEEHVKKRGPLLATVYYWINVFRFVNRFTLSRPKEDFSTHAHPFWFMRNYLTTSIRFLMRNKQFAVINILGLTIGLTSCLAILLFGLHEFSFDRFHEGHEKVFRVNMSYEDNAGNINVLVNSPPALVPGTRGLFPEVVKASRLRYTMRCLLSHGENRFYEDQGYYADSLFLEILPFKLSSGDADRALDQPNSIVITEDLALKYFDKTDVLGEVLLLNNSLSLEVTGILKPIPTNSHLDFQYLISFPTYVVPDGYASNLDSWGWLGFLTYVSLREETAGAGFQAKLNQFLDDRTPPGRKPLKSIVQNVEDIYLSSQGMTDDLASPIRFGNKQHVTALFIVALLILAIATLNFLNLTSALSINRQKTVGVRKVLGARRTAIFFQMLTESTLIALLCLVLSYALAVFFSPAVTKALGGDMTITVELVLSTIPFMLPLALMIGLISGGQPATRLSGLSITHAMKGHGEGAQMGAFGLRNVLLILQFCIAIAMICATLVLSQQTRFLQNQSLGLTKENVIVIKLLPEAMARHFATFKRQLQQNATVVSVSQSERLIGDPWPINPIRQSDQDQSQSKVLSGNLVGYDYFRTMNIKLKEGRTFSREFPSDSASAIVITEKAAEFMNLENPVGTRVHFFDLDGPRTIIGVVENFNFSSLHQEILPAVMILPFIDLEYMYIRVRPGNVAEQLHTIQQTWAGISPNSPMEFRFLDDRIHRLYESEERLTRLINGFAILAILLAVLGLYALVSYMINRRLKEVSIRQVLGAGSFRLFALLTKKYLLFILLASLVSIPFIHYLLNQWLGNFAYRIDVSWTVYGIAFLVLLTVSLVTVTLRTWRAVRTNPADILRSE